MHKTHRWKYCEQCSVSNTPKCQTFPSIAKAQRNFHSRQIVLAALIMTVDDCFVLTHLCTKLTPTSGIFRNWKTKPASIYLDTREVFHSFCYLPSHRHQRFVLHDVSNNFGIFVCKAIEQKRQCFIGIWKAQPGFLCETDPTEHPKSTVFSRQGYFHFPKSSRT